MITLAQAQLELQQSATCRLGSERVPLLRALGRVSEVVASDLAIPPTDNSAMDGFAIRAADLQLNTTLSISQRVPAGAQPDPLSPGTAARIFTGGVMPQGADAQCGF